MRSGNAQNTTHEVKPKWKILLTNDYYWKENSIKHRTYSETKNGAKTNKKSSSIANISAFYCI